MAKTWFGELRKERYGRNLIWRIFEKNRQIFFSPKLVTLRYIFFLCDLNTKIVDKQRQKCYNKNLKNIISYTTPIVNVECVNATSHNLELNFCVFKKIDILSPSQFSMLFFFKDIFLFFFSFFLAAVVFFVFCLHMFIQFLFWYIIFGWLLNCNYSVLRGVDWVNLLPDWII